MACAPRDVPLEGPCEKIEYWLVGRCLVLDLTAMPHTHPPDASGRNVAPRAARLRSCSPLIVRSPRHAALAVVVEPHPDERDRKLSDR